MEMGMNWYLNGNIYIYDGVEVHKTLWFLLIFRAYAV